MGGTHPVPQAARNACYACTTQPFEAVTLEHEPMHYNHDELFVSIWERRNFYTDSVVH